MSDEIDIDGDSLRGLSKLAELVRDFPQFNSPEADQCFGVIADILLDNVECLALDEDFTHLTSFARSIACELLSKELRNSSFGGQCWTAHPYYSFPPFFRKKAGNNVLDGDVRPVFSQKVGMAAMLAIHLIPDPAYASGAQELLDYSNYQASLFVGISQKDRMAEIPAPSTAPAPAAAADEPVEDNPYHRHLLMSAYGGTFPK